MMSDKHLEVKYNNDYDVELLNVNHYQDKDDKRNYKIGVFALSIVLLFVALLGIVAFSHYYTVFQNSSFEKSYNAELYSMNNNNSVLLISMDGFRHDYIEIAKNVYNLSLPNFDYMIKNGVRAKAVTNAFPTITLPNHHTLVTGLYPESNGIVLNNFIDPKYPKLEFEMDDQTTLNQEFWFKNQPEPIWVTLQKQNVRPNGLCELLANYKNDSSYLYYCKKTFQDATNHDNDDDKKFFSKKRLSGSMLWPITDAKYGEDLPFQQVSQFTMLDGLPARYPYDKRVETVIWWLDNPRYHLDLVLMYYDEPDETGHSYGPNSKQVAAKVKELDTSLGQLLNKMAEHGLTDKVDIILTADHGMAEISGAREIALDKFVDSKLYTYTLLTPVGAIYPYKSSDLLGIYSKLKNAHPRLQVYLKGQVPQHLHYNHNARIAPLILVADDGWSIVHTSSGKKYIGGNHGYDQREADMHPFLLAMGPSFQVNYQVPMLHSVDVYPLMCHILQMKCNPSNGSLSRIQHILKPASSGNGLTNSDLDSLANACLFNYWYKVLSTLSLFAACLVTLFVLMRVLTSKRRATIM